MGGQPLGDGPEHLLADRGVAGVICGALRRLVDEAAPETRVPVPRHAHRPVLRGHERDPEPADPSSISHQPSSTTLSMPAFVSTARLSLGPRRPRAGSRSASVRASARPCGRSARARPSPRRAAAVLEAPRRAPRAAAAGRCARATPGRSRRAARRAAGRSVACPIQVRCGPCARRADPSLSRRGVVKGEAGARLPARRSPICHLRMSRSPLSGIVPSRFMYRGTQPPCRRCGGFSRRLLAG